MSDHSRLYRRHATYYHLPAIRVYIKDTYSKPEETLSLKTKDKTKADFGPLVWLRSLMRCFALNGLILFCTFCAMKSTLILD